MTIKVRFTKQEVLNALQSNTVAAMVSNTTVPVKLQQSIVDKINDMDVLIEKDCASVSVESN